jgi:hypothetical protein
MIIDSDFLDYYDAVGRTHRNTSIVYLRKQQEKKLNIDRKSFPFSSPTPSTIIGNGGSEFLVSSILRVIGFCGKLYPMATITIRPKNGQKTSVYNFYCVDEIERVFKSMGLPVSNKQSYYSGDVVGFGKNKALSLGFFKTFFLNIENKLKLGNDFFHVQKTPVFMIQRVKIEATITINPKLQDFEFGKVKDSYTAFQDIQSFISGVLGSSTAQPEKISDEVMAASKGHDGKYSFKKPPSKKGKKQWR